MKKFHIDFEKIYIPLGGLGVWKPKNFYQFLWGLAFGLVGLLGGLTIVWLLIQFSWAVYALARL